MLNVRHPPEVHGQVGRAEVQEVEEAELQRHAAVTQHLQSVPLAALVEITEHPRFTSCLNLVALLELTKKAMRLRKK